MPCTPARRSASCSRPARRAGSCKPGFRPAPLAHPPWLLRRQVACMRLPSVLIVDRTLCSAQPSSSPPARTGALSVVDVKQEPSADGGGYARGPCSPAAAFLVASGGRCPVLAAYDAWARWGWLLGMIGRCLRADSVWPERVQMMTSPVRARPSWRVRAARPCGDVTRVTGHVAVHASSRDADARAAYVRHPGRLG